MKKDTKLCFVKENAGTSIVELLMIIAIIVVLAASAVNLFGHMNGKQARQCAYKLEAALSEIRVETMSKSTGEKESVYFMLESIDDTVHAGRIIKGNVSSDVIGQKVTITVGDNGRDLKEGPVALYFNRATGALLEESFPYATFYISQGNTTYVVAVEPTTGRISCERQ